MRTSATLIVLLALGARPALAQFGGNAAFAQGGGRARAEQNERAKRQINRDDMPPTATAIFLDASVLMNVKADEYVATFGVTEEAETVEACQAKMEATLARFRESIGKLGVPPEAIFVDFTAQTKLYKFKVDGDVAREQIDGFELKKAVSVRFRDKTMVDRLLAAASREKIYDLIKVEYVVEDLAAVQDRLAEAASEVLRAKAARHQRLLGIKLRAVPQIYVERASVYQPSDMYDSYVASESGAVADAGEHGKTRVESLRKTRTFYYNPLGPDGFDRVIAPVILEPVVQFTLYLKLRYEIEPRD